MKRDSSIRAICIASIKRHTVKPFEFAFTRFFETGPFSEVLDGNFKVPDRCQNGLPISQTVVNKLNWTLVTSRQIISCIGQTEKFATANEVQSWKWNDFKGYGKTPYTVGKLILNNQQKFEVFIETGKASMVMIYAIMTLVRQLST